MIVSGISVGGLPAIPYLLFSSHPFSPSVPLYNAFVPVLHHI